MAKIKCSVCGNEIDDTDQFCGKCGSNLPDKQWEKIAASEEPTIIYVEPSPSRTAYDSQQRSASAITDSLPKVQKVKRKKWYTPPKRPRPAYHPIEWFFWLGWGIYIVLRFIITEILNFFIWACYWGPPRELRKDR